MKKKCYMCEKRRDVFHSKNCKAPGEKYQIHFCEECYYDSKESIGYDEW